MATYFSKPQIQHDPLVLIVPDHDRSGPDDWHAAWARQRDDCRLLELGDWDNPHRNTWVNKLNLAIHRAERSVVLVAHRLSCLAVAWWAEYERPSYGNPVIGALLVAPPDVDRPACDPRLARFGACPRQKLPFPSFLLASTNDPSCARDTSWMLANDWGSRFVDAGASGHIDREPGLFGQRLLRRLLSEHAGIRRHPPAQRYSGERTPTLVT